MQLKKSNDDHKINISPTTPGLTRSNTRKKILVIETYRITEICLYKCVKEEIHSSEELSNRNAMHLKSLETVE